MDFVDLNVTQSLTSQQTCFNVSVLDDSIEEGTESFTVSGSIVSSDLPLTFDPAQTEVFIEDDGKISLQLHT